MVLFTTKYAPKSSAQVYGQQKAVSELKDFINNYKQKKHKAALIYGPIGNGKTSSIYALAQELNYEILELNSSDLRNQEHLGSFLSSALAQRSLFFRPKIVLLDEIDNVSGMADRGAIPALLKAIPNSMFPVILTANDPFDSKFKELVKVCQMIEFEQLDHKIIAAALQNVCKQENINYEEKAINSLARQVDGDLRGALIDLQLSSMNKKFKFADIQTLSDRKRTKSILKALAVIFKSSSIENALPVLDDIDLEIREVFLWIDENLPKEYLNPKALAKAYEHLARADVFNGRIKRQQHWRFLVYITNLLTAGISSAKEEKNTDFIPYKPTMRILRIWQAKMKNAKRKEFAEKLGLATHTSNKVAWEQVPYFKEIFRKSKVQDLTAQNLARELKLTEEEVAWLRQ